MLVFISWSGPRSKAIAEALEGWLEQVIQAVEPWISQDIEKGLRWTAEIADRLERSKVGIICLSKSNLDSKWIHYEAGALSKTKDAYVCTLLLDIKPAEVEQPLAQFQHTTTEKEDIYQLLSTVNRAVDKSGEKALAEATLRKVFETYWPDLEKAFSDAAALPEATPSPSRSTGEMLQEVLEILRNQERRQSRPARPEVAQRVPPSFAGSSLDIGWRKIYKMTLRLEGDTIKINDLLANEKLANSLLDYDVIAGAKEGFFFITLRLTMPLNFEELAAIAESVGLKLVKVTF